ncbi:MAG TPA: methyltransferase domain-containing protein [Victivallales bacterium]|nr:methyltransferase domain-containing protein [Victivallales bacterium]
MNLFRKDREWLKRNFLKIWKKITKRKVWWGNLRSTKPFSRVFGYDRGNQSIARYYIDNFIFSCKADIKGNILEIGDDTYTKKFGTKIKKSDVLHVTSGNSKATIVADLTIDQSIPSGTYDCIIMTQTLPFIYNIKAALKNTYRILKPGGTLLVTLSGISQVSRYDMDRWGEYWRFTSLSAKKLFEEFFPPENIKVEAFGNLLAAVALLEGLASCELRKKELDINDPDYEVIITVRAIKPL